MGPYVVLLSSAPIFNNRTTSTAIKQEHIANATFSSWLRAHGYRLTKYGSERFYEYPVIVS